jgi:hypothetical protein
LNGVTIAVPHPRNFMFIPWKFHPFYGKSGFYAEGTSGAAAQPLEGKMITAGRRCP